MLLNRQTDNADKGKIRISIQHRIREEENRITFFVEQMVTKSQNIPMPIKEVHCIFI